MIALALANFLLLVACIPLAAHQAFGEARGTVVNPILFLGVLLCIMNLDFLTLVLDPSSISIFENRVAFYGDEISSAYSLFTLFTGSLIAGIAVGIFTSRAPRSASVRVAAHDVTAARCVFGFILVTAIALSAVYLKDLSAIVSGQVSRQVYFRENQLTILSFQMLVPAFALFLRSRGTLDGTVWIALLTCCLLLVISGSRGAILLLGLVFVAWLVSIGKKIKWTAVFPLLPIAFCGLLVNRYLFREAWRHASLADFVASSGGLVSTFFKSAEISFAEVLVAAKQYEPYIDIQALDGFIGAASYPLPRALFPWKPLSASGEFTSVVSPARWELTKSEVLVTGYGNTFLEFGIVLGAVVVLLIGMVWARALLATRSVGFFPLAIYPFVVWWMYVFLRGDFFNLGASIWSVGLVAVLFASVRILMRVRVGVRSKDV